MIFAARCANAAIFAEWSKTLDPLIFNFYQLVRLEVWSTDERARSFYRAEYGHHLQQGEQPFQAVVRLRINQPEHSARLKFHTHKLLARWRYGIAFRADDIDIEARGNYFSIPMIHHMLVHPALRFLASTKGVLMLHAGGVSRAGKSVLFSGKGGTGKTTTTAILLSDRQTGWQVHADDYVFLTPQPQSLAYMTRQHIYLPLLKWAPQVGEVMNAWERSGLFVFGHLRRWSREGLKWPVRIEPERAWPQNGLCFEARPAGLVLLRRDQREKAELRPLADSAAALDELIEMNFEEARHFIHLASAVHPDFDQRLAAWQRRERELLAAVIEKVPLYELVLPYTTQDFRSAQMRISALLLSIME